VVADCWLVWKGPETARGMVGAWVKDVTMKAVLMY
jgi:hypothetical protein